MVAREAEKESVFYENQEAAAQEQESTGALPQPAWAASAAGTVHLGAQSWDFGVNISHAAPPTPGYDHNLAGFLPLSMPRRLVNVHRPHLSPESRVCLCAGDARPASSPGCRLPRRLDGLPTAGFRVPRGHQTTRLDTGGGGSTQPPHSRGPESLHATSADHRRGPG